MSFLLPTLPIQASTAPDTSAAQSNIAQYDLAFQISPIILQGGIAASVQGQAIPISSLLPGPDTTTRGEAGEPFARFVPAPGSTLISQGVGMYPFANQVVAANATIQNPLTLSMHMIVPVNRKGGYISKLHAMTSLQNALQAHNAAEGTYFVATPAFIYTNMLLLQIADVTPEISIENPQAQIHFQLDFSRPVITQQDAQQALNNTMSKIASGGQLNSVTWSGQLSSNPATATGNAAAAISLFGGSAGSA